MTSASGWARLPPRSDCRRHASRICFEAWSASRRSAFCASCGSNAPASCWKRIVRRSAAYGSSRCGAAYSPTDLKNPYSVVSGAPPVRKASEHYFFTVSAFADFLKGWVDTATLNEGVKNKLREWLDADPGPAVESWSTVRLRLLHPSNQAGPPTVAPILLPPARVYRARPHVGRHAPFPSQAARRRSQYRVPSVGRRLGGDGRPLPGRVGPLGAEGTGHTGCPDQRQLPEFRAGAPPTARRGYVESRAGSLMMNSALPSCWVYSRRPPSHLSVLS